MTETESAEDFQRRRTLEDRIFEDVRRRLLILGSILLALISLGVVGWYSALEKRIEDAVVTNLRTKVEGQMDPVLKGAIATADRATEQARMAMAKGEVADELMKHTYDRIRTLDVGLRELESKRDFLKAYDELVRRFEALDPKDASEALQKLALEASRVTQFESRFGALETSVDRVRDELAKILPSQFLADLEKVRNDIEGLKTEFTGIKEASRSFISLNTRRGQAQWGGGEAPIALDWKREEIVGADEEIGPAIVLFVADSDGRGPLLGMCRKAEWSNNVISGTLRQASGTSYAKGSFDGDFYIIALGKRKWK